MLPCGCCWFWVDTLRDSLVWLTLLSHTHPIIRLQDHLCLVLVNTLATPIKTHLLVSSQILSWRALYFSPLLSPVISNSWSIEEWSVRQNEYKDCLTLKRPEDIATKNGADPAVKRHTGYRLLSFLMGNLKKSLTITWRLLVRIFGHRPLQLLGAN